ncbi:amidohydrolase [Herbiconiux sp. A18JL235]|uniref:Amidohydrolase n=1 Tax=Herbiconiux sp. A18JL235 TaxID=3152363 RepID=A0AB39BIN6_9MICO
MDHADARQTVFAGGSYFTAGMTRSVDGAVLVREGRILAVGSSAEVEAAALAATADGPAPSRGETRRVDLAGGLVVPGFQDSHVHPAPAGLEMLQCDLSAAESADEALAIVRRYAAETPGEWLFGGGWSMDHFAGGTPDRRLLDEVTAGRPAYFMSRDHHSAWVNTAALERAGITAATPDPADGKFERDPDGTPSGTVHEGALTLFETVKPLPDADLAYRGLLAAQDHLLSLGITGWQDALVGEGLGFGDALPLYLRGVDEGRLRARVTGALWWNRDAGLEQLDSLMERRRRAAALGRPELFAADTVKMMLDGIVENHTASIHGRYAVPGLAPEVASGLDFVSPPHLAEYVAALDAEAFSVHFHALGDRAVSQALDALAGLARSARAAGADAPSLRPPRRHQLAHLQMVADADIARFASVGAIANLQAFWARTDDQLRDLCLPILPAGARERSYPFGRIARAGAALAFGSDWPVSSAYPLDAVQVAVTRTGFGAEPEPLGGDRDKLDLATALAGYTAGSAHANGRGDTTGRLAPGHLADLAVLDRDPFDSGPERIAEARVVSTWIGGVRVH